MRFLFLHPLKKLLRASRKSLRKTRNFLKISNLRVLLFKNIFTFALSNE